MSTSFLRLFDRALVDKYIWFAMTPDVEFECGHRLEQVRVGGLTGRDHCLDTLGPRIESKGMTDEGIQVFGTSVCEIDRDLACAVIGVADDKQAAQGSLGAAKADSLVENGPGNDSGACCRPELPALADESTAHCNGSRPHYPRACFVEGHFRNQWRQFCGGPCGTVQLRLGKDE